MQLFGGDAFGSPSRLGTNISCYRPECIVAGSAKGGAPLASPTLHSRYTEITECSRSYVTTTS